jgi:hypothetical protein
MDGIGLVRIADVLIEGEVPNLTEAMRWAGVSKDADHRRLRNKWNAQGSTHLDGAHVRRRAEAKARWNETIAQGRALLNSLATGILNISREANAAIERWQKNNPETADNVRRFLGQTAALQNAAKKGRPGV